MRPQGTFQDLLDTNRAERFAVPLHDATVVFEILEEDIELVVGLALELRLRLVRFCRHAFQIMVEEPA